MTDKFQTIIICSILCFLLGCNMSKLSPYLEKARIEYYSTLAEQIIAQEFPHIEFEGFHSCDIWNDKDNNTHVSYIRDSDREEYKGQLNYCHDNFIRETITVVITESREMLSVSIKKQRMGLECIDLINSDLAVE